MLCEKCGKNHATTHIKTVVNGVVKEYNLCAYCAAKEGYSTNSLAGMLASMFGEISGSELLGHQTKCSVCGSTFSDIAKTGKVGCSECYTTFYDELLPYLKRVHGSTKHVGKVPNSAPLMVKPQTKTVEDLRNELTRLIAEENYEQAAVIRDKIKEMEGKGNE
ncbi:MAG: UvrB/UvrC motif-containing protein [Acutalibacteraceae bacterium]|jgi:protein arginine kinase activator|nr:UvrB/UvrC motif-containing protein [Acutalibacteraceae bacterium]